MSNKGSLDSRKKKIIWGSISGVLAAILIAVIIFLVSRCQPNPVPPTDYTVNLNYKNTHYKQKPQATSTKIGEDVVIDFEIIDEPTPEINGVYVTYNDYTFFGAIPKEEETYPIIVTQSKITIPYDTVIRPSGSGYKIDVRIDTSRDYDIKFSLNEGIKQAQAANSVEYGQDVYCEYVLMEGLEVQTLNPKTSYVKIGDEIIYGVEVFKDVQKSKFIIDHTKLGGATSFEVFLDAGNGPKWNNVTINTPVIEDNPTAYAGVFKNDFEKRTLEIAYYILPTYQIDLTAPETEGGEGGTHIYIKDKDYYYGDPTNVWRIETEGNTHKIVIDVPEGIKQDDVIRAEIRTNDSKLPIEHFESTSGFFEDMPFEVIKATPGEDIEVKWNLLTGYDIDPNADVTFFEMVFKKGDQEYRLRAPYDLNDIDKKITIKWSQKWSEAEIVRLEAHAGCVNS